MKFTQGIRYTQVNERTSVSADGMAKVAEFSHIFDIIITNFDDDLALSPKIIDLVF